MTQVLKIMPGAEAFAVGSDEAAGALLLHGFTGSPHSMRGIGEYLAARGIAVTCPLLPGHGTTWQDLNTKRLEDWVEAVETSFQELTARHDEVYLVALSFGAALALDLAARYPDRVDGIVTLAGFVHTKDPRKHLAPIIRYLVRSLPPVGNDIAAPGMDEICYDRFPTRAAYWMLKMLDRARRALPSVTAPILVMHGRHDKTVAPYNAQLIYDSVGSSDKDIAYMERSAHVITMDYDKDELYERTFAFIKEHSKVL